MNVNISFESNYSYLDLLLAFKAISPMDSNSKMTFTDDVLGTIIFQPVVNSVIFKPKDVEYYFLTENISIGEVHELFNHFMCGSLEELENFSWLGKYPKATNHISEDK